MHLAIEISRHRCAARLTDDAGHSVAALQRELPANAASAAQWVATMELCRTLLGRSQVEAGQITRTALCIAQALDEHGKIAKNERAAGWAGYDLGRALQEHLGLRDVLITTRTRAEALAQFHLGALKNEDNCIYVHLGGVIEATVRCNGNWLLGATGLAGDLGAVIVEREGAIDSQGRRGSLSAYCGGEAFMAWANTYGLTFVMPHEIWDLAPTNFAAQSVATDFTSRFAQALTGAIALLNPSTICLGGAFGDAIFERLAAPLLARIKELAPLQSVDKLKLVPATLAGEAALQGPFSWHGTAWLEFGTTGHQARYALPI